MRRYQQHTHASWHRAYEGKAECPWCHEGPREEPRPQSTHYKRPSKRPDTQCTNRTDLTSPAPVRPDDHSIKQPDVASTEQTAQFELHSDPAPHADDAEVPPEDEIQYTKYMGRTVRHEGMNGAFAIDPPRPRLPEAWTQENEEQELGSKDWNESTVEDWRSGLDASGDTREYSEEKVGSLEPEVKELDES